MSDSLQNPVSGEEIIFEGQAQLLPNETVLWKGRPARGLVFTPDDIVIIPFSFIWSWFALSGTVAQLKSFSLFMLIFWGFAAYFVVGRFILDAWIREGTRYTITNKRILIDRGGPFAKLIAVDRDKLADIELRKGGGGKGTLRFGQPQSGWFSNRRQGVTIPSFDPTPQFIRIDGVDEVFDLLQRRKAQPL